MAKKSDKPLPEGLRPEDFQTDEEAREFARGTLSGDIRDVLLTHVRSMRVPWAMLSEQEQREKINAISECGRDVVRRALSTVVRGDLPAVEVEVGAYKVDKGMEIKLSTVATVDNVTKVAMHGKGHAVLILAGAEDYFGERAEVQPAKDQPNLPLEGDEEDA